MFTRKKIMMEPPSRYDPNSMSRIGDIEAELADTEFLSVSHDPEKPNSRLGLNSRKPAQIAAIFVFAGLFVSLAVSMPVLLKHHQRSSKDKNTNDQKAIVKTSSDSENSKIIAMAPHYITDMCSPFSILTPTGYNNCSKTCEESYCCDNINNASCKSITSRDHCPTYKPCTSLTHNESTASIIKSHCTEDVTKDNVMKTTCAEACLPGICCFSGNLSKGGCNTPENLAFCEQFHPCKAMDIISPSWYKEYEQNEEEIKASLEQACGGLSNAIDAGNTNFRNDYMECHNKCQDHTCCFTNQDSLSCADAIADKCTLYDTCKVLAVSSQHKYNDTYTLEEARVEAQIMCKDESLATSLGYESCYTICSPFLCCFSEDNNCNNPFDSNSHCKDFTVCKNIHDISTKDQDSEYEIPEDELNSLCNPDEVLKSEDNHYKCFDVCSPYLSLFSSPDHDCGANLKCQHYLPCKIVLAQNVTITEQVGITCAPSKLKNLEGVQACHSTCKEHFCCFSDDASCYNENVLECEAYDACSTLLAYENTDDPSFVTHDDVKEACSDTNSSDGLMMCQQKCVDHLCCFGNENLASSCNNDPDKNCDQFIACEILINGDLDPDSLIDSYEGPSELTNECDFENILTQQGWNDCRDICDQAACCFNAGAGNCYNFNMQRCDSFKKCSSLGTKGLLHDSHYNKDPLGPPLEKEVTEMCQTSKLVSTPTNGEESNFKICKRVCEEVACCKTATCSSDLEAKCNLYIGCADYFEFITEENS